MSRKHPSDTPIHPFKRLLGWTLLLALVFSAGLITGERILRKKSRDALVAVDDQVTEAHEESADEEMAEKPRSFAFFDQLSQKAQVSLSASRRAENAKPDEKPTPESAKKKEAAPESAAKQESVKQEAAKQESVKQEAAKQEAAKKAEAEEAAAPPEESAKAKADAPARYTLQVAAHPDLDGAKEHMERLRGMRLEPQLVSAAIPGKGTFYRVRVGKFATTKQAQAFQDKLKSDNSLSTFVSPL